MSELYHIQILVVSTLGLRTTLIRPDGSSSVSDSLTSIVLGHFHDGYSDHQVCLDADRDAIQEVVAVRTGDAFKIGND